MKLQPRQAVTLRQFTNESPEVITDRLKAYLYTGGNPTIFFRGIAWMQIREEFEGQELLNPEDFRYDLENIFETTCWTPWHFRLIKELRKYFGRHKFTRFCQMAKELNRMDGLERLGFNTLAQYVLGSMIQVKLAEDNDSKASWLQEAVSALRELNWQERAALHQQLAVTLQHARLLL